MAYTINLENIKNLVSRLIGEFKPMTGGGKGEYSPHCKKQK